MFPKRVVALPVVPFLIFLAFLSCICFPKVLLAQTDAQSIHGRVRDTQGHALKDVAVTIKETGVATKTNDAGEFTLAASGSRTLHIEFSVPGFFPQTQTVDAGNDTDLDIALAPSMIVKQEVRVVASRLDIPLAQNAAGTTVLGLETLSHMPRAIAAEEALDSVPGVKVDNQANQERVHISIRGQGILTERGIRGIEVLLDGLPLNDPSGFAPDLFDVDWSDVQEVTVVRGPVAFLYGGGSSGGVIDITTRTPSEQPHGSIDASGGSNGFYKGHAEYSGNLGGAAVFLSAGRGAGDGYRVHTRFYGDNLYGKLSLKPTSRLQLNIVGAGIGYFNQNPEGLNWPQVLQDPRQPNPDALTYNEYQKTKRGTGGLVGQWTPTNTQRVSFSFYARQTHFDESVPSSVQHRDFTAPGGSAQYELERGSGWMKHHFSAGVDLDGQMIDDWRHPHLSGSPIETSDLVADQSITQKRVAGFLTERIGLGQKWMLLGSVRWDHIGNELEDRLRLNGLDLSGSRTFDRATGRVGLTFNPRKDVGFYTSWGQGFLPPATEELYANPDALGGFNKRLVPARSWGLEGGMRGSVRDRVFYDVSIFHLDTRNDFERYRIAGRPLETFYGNAGATSRYGVETEVRWVPVSRVTFSGAYTYSHFTYTEYVSNVYTNNIVGNWLPNSPNHQVFFDTTLELPHSVFLGVSTNAYSRAFIDPTNRPATPTNTAFIDGYGLLNARLSKDFQQGRANFKFFVNGRNLTGTKYIAFTEPDPDGNSYQPGPTREVFGGVEIRF